jgi:uncharacterized membrane protein
MSAAWTTIAALAVATALIRASGPVLVGGRALPTRALDVVALLAPALLAALVIVETLGGPGRSLELDARLLGVTAAAISLAIRNSILPAVAVAAATTALARALT